MKGLRKRAVVLAAVAALAMSSLAGCSRDFTVDNNKVAAVVGDSEITLGVLNFYVRYDQISFESYYGAYLGDNLWRVEASEGVTLEESAKNSALTILSQMYILEDHMSEYGVEITAEDKAMFESVADAFIEANGEEKCTLISATKENIVEVLKLYTISERMYEAIVADVSTEVSDDEAAQKKLAYLGFTANDNITEEDALKEAELFLEEAKKSGDLMKVADEQKAPAYEVNYDDKTTSVAKEIMDAANALEEGQFAEIVKKDKSYYVVQLVSEFDKEATDAKKAEIVKERQDTKYDEVYTKWDKAAEVKINEDVAEDINLHGLKITAKAKKTEK